MTMGARTTDERRVVFSPDRDLTAATVTGFRQRLREIVADGAGELVFDLSAVAMVDSSGVGLLIAAWNTMTQRGGAFRVVGASADLLGMFRAIRLDAHFPIEARP